LTAVEQPLERPGAVRRITRAVGVVPVALRVTLVVLAFHGAWIAAYLAAGHEARDFIKIGWFQGSSDASDVIEVDPTYTPPRNRGLSQGTGYDGQFSYYMALDFRNSPEYLDFPAYRYGRILYPVLARGVALGDPDRVPAAMIAINWLALGGATLALAAWLRRRRLSPWLALLVGLYPGLLLGVQRDLTEPLAYALVAAAIYLSDYGGRYRLLWAGLVFGLAGLARQTTLVFPLCLLGALLLEGKSGRPLRIRLAENWRPATRFAVLSFAPAVGFAAFIYVWLGDFGTGAGLESVPFLGLFGPDWAAERQGAALALVAVPALVVSAVVLGALREGFRRVEFAYLLANVLLFVVFLGRLSYRDGYTSVARVTTGVVLGAVVCLPWLPPLTPRMRLALFACFGIWMSMLPVIAGYGFGG
jgi:hypothetical protein